MAIGKRSLAGLVCLLASSAFAGFGATEAYLPSVGRIPGKNGAQFYTTVWATNLTSAPQTFTFRFLKAGQSNPSPASFQDSLQPGETKVYENVVETKLGLTDALGAARITSSGEIFVSERIYNQEPGDDLGKTEGLFFAGVPKSFSISAGQSASLQGVDQGGTENFRYNFALVETGGGSAEVNVQIFDGNGTLLGQRSFPLSPWEQIQPSVADVAPSIATTNARITATVVDGDGSVLLAGAQVANESQDSSGFEMTFRDELLGAGGTAGVTSLNGLTGAVTIAHGANTTVNVNGQTITIDAVSGSGTGLTAVAHDNSLAGSGTVPVPLGIAIGQVVRSLNGLHDAVTLTAGSNVTITPSGQTLTIASTGGGAGGLTLPFSGSTNGSGVAFSIANTGVGDGIHGSSGGNGGSGVYGTTRGTSGETGGGGVWGDSHDGTAVQGTSAGAVGVLGITNNTTAAGAVEGLNRAFHGIGVLGRTGNGSGLTLGSGSSRFLFQGAGVWGDSPFAGVIGSSLNGPGVWGIGGIYAQDGLLADCNTTNCDAGDFFGNVAVSGNVGVTSGNATAIQGTTNGNTSAGVQGHNQANQNDGYLGGENYGVLGTSHNANAVIGQTSHNTAAGVEGDNTTTGTKGYLGGENYGVYAFGGFAGTGGKYFVEPHPTDPSKEIRYVCLEGPESGTYFRGTGRIVNGFATIEVPEHFRMVTAERGLTVVATPVGALAVLAAVHQDLNRIVIQGSSDVEFNYVVNGVRKALEDHQPVSENSDFVPRSSDDVKTWKALPAESYRRLVANGTLNADGSINLETAHRLGWDRQETWKRAEERAQR